MLDTRFPRIDGDIGHAATFPFPVRRVTVHGASPRRVVVERDGSLVAAFVDAARVLARDGASAITTSCGFLVRVQHELAAAVDVPVWTSSLLLLAELNGSLRQGRRAGIVTVDAGSLGADDMRAAAAPADTPIEGLAVGSAFRRTLLDDTAALDEAEARDATVAAARRLVARHPEVAAIVLECTNMPPYRDAVAAATGRPVHDITTLIATRFATAASGR